MAKKPREAPDGGTWMNTYSDLVTLLLCFFVLLYSMSVVDADKWKKFASAFNGNIDNLVEGPGDGKEDPVTSPPTDPGEDGEALDDLYEQMKEYTEDQGMAESVELVKGDGIVYIRFNSNVFFRPDQATIISDSLPVLDFFGDCIKSVEDQIYLININGHTARVESSSYPVSSRLLSSERAANIAVFFENNKKLDPKKLRPIGYGNEYPVATNDTEEGRQQNRRVDIVIVSVDAEIPKEFDGLFDPGAFPTTGDPLTP